MSELAAGIQSCISDLARAPGPDPYWPKWNNRWWQLALLDELGAIGQVPAALLEDFATEIEQHYLPDFPLLEADLPAGKDGHRHILCHCALGTASRILFQGGIDVWQRLPWLYDWLWRYQLPDGGYNCDEQAYLGSRKSSLVSSAPVFEALLVSRPDGIFTQAETELLQAGLTYFVEHRLIRRRSGELIDPDWLQPLFPRFYEYDLLRGLKLVTDLSLALKQPLPAAAIKEAVSLLEQHELNPQSWRLAQEKTLALSAEDWIREPVSLFALLEAAIAQGHVYLRQQWQQVQATLATLKARGLLI
jgi:hypothetical protein